jgi:hypothetical protein
MPYLAYFLMLALLALPNRADPPTTSDGQRGPADVAPLGPAVSTLAVGEASPLDDEVEIPDEDEDDDPDDLGPALESEESFLPSILADAAPPAHIPSASAPRLGAMASLEWTHLDCSGLCRFRC